MGHNAEVPSQRIIHEAFHLQQKSPKTPRYPKSALKYLFVFWKRPQCKRYYCGNSNRTSPLSFTSLWTQQLPWCTPLIPSWLIIIKQVARGVLPVSRSGQLPWTTSFFTRDPRKKLNYQLTRDSWSTQTSFYCTAGLSCSPQEVAGSISSLTVTTTTLNIASWVWWTRI